MKNYYYLPLAIFIAMAGLGVSMISPPPQIIKTPVLPDGSFDYRIINPYKISTEKKPQLISPEENLNNELVTLGRVLFYDTQLSLSNEVSCASCHKQAHSFADNTPFSIGFSGAPTTRNSPNLNNIPELDNFIPDDPHFFWDGREKVLETMVLQPIAHADEMGKDLNYLPTKLSELPYYESLFENAFGTPNISIPRIGDALSQFIRSMVSYDTKYDIGVSQNFSNFSIEELAGKELFFDNCVNCHQAPEFGISYQINNGLDSIYTDQGKATWSGEEADIGKFKSPSIRNISKTAPYMHDGRFQTLEEVIDFYSEGIFPHPNSTFVESFGDTFIGFQFSETEKEALHDFLLTLTDYTLLEDEKWSNPFPLFSEVDVLMELNNVNIFPNPSSTDLFIEFPDNIEKWKSVRLFDIHGKLLWSAESQAKKVHFSTADLSSGMYLLEIKIARQLIVEKVMVQ